MAGKTFICIVVLVITMNLLYYGSGEYYRAHNYIKKFCQVIKSGADDRKCHRKNNRNCYQPVWSVLYDRPDIDDEPVEGVIRSRSFLSLTEALSRIKEYQVNRIYICYHDKEQDVVQWKRPDRRGALIRLVLGLVLPPVAFGCWWLFSVCREHGYLATPAVSADAPEADGNELENVATAKDRPSKLSTAV